MKTVEVEAVNVKILQMFYDKIKKNIQVTEFHF